MENLLIKKANEDILKELNSIEFDLSYIDKAKDKYKGSAYKIFNLKPHEANILKQMCLSLGFDCAVSRNTITCQCEYTDAIVFGSVSQLNKLVDKLNFQPFRLKQVSNILNGILNNTLMPITVNNVTFDWTRPYVMGIVNVTENSFSDGGKYSTIDKAYAHAIELINDGADIIDIGSEATNSNATEISVDEEINKLVPLIAKIKKTNKNSVISVDTRNYQTAFECINAGADIINDVSGLTHDKKLFEYVNSTQIPTIIMHSDKIPAQSADFTKNDIVEEIYKDLQDKINSIQNPNIIIDMGIGFGKATNSNFEILKRIEEFQSLNKPILTGISRKSFITKSFDIDTEKADVPTALYGAILSLKGVNIHRVHNIKLAKEFLDYTQKLLN